MAKAMVVVRHLNEKSEPVASTVINEPSEYVDDMEHYFNSRAAEHIEDMKRNFVNLEMQNFIPIFLIQSNKDIEHVLIYTKRSTRRYICF